MPSNPFALLLGDDEEDVGTTVKAPEEAPKVVVKPTQQAKGAAGSKAAPVSSAKPVEHKEAAAAAPKAASSLPPRQRKPRPAAPAAAGSVAATAEPESDKPKDSTRRMAHRDNRDGHSQRNERQSHTRPQKGGEHPKKEGHGLGNWGSTKDEIVEESKAATEGEAEATPAAAVAAVEESTEAPKEEEPKTVSYEEFMKQKESKRSSVPSLPSVRKAGEGDKTKWEATEQMIVKEEDDSADKLSSERKSQRAFKKQTVAIDVQFPAHERTESSPREGGSFRGGRGGGAGRGASRGGRGGNTSRPPRSSNGADSKAPAFNIEADFPKL